MNPETNRFEPLSIDDGTDAEALEKAFAERLESVMGAAEAVQPASLVRPDGTPVPEHWPIFKVDEEVVVKGYVFRVAYIGETTLLLEPVRMAP